MITESQLMAWVGNDGYADQQIEFMSDILTDIANGKYLPKELHDEVEEYNK